MATKNKTTGQRTTSASVASKAARVVRSEEATADERSVAASALAQAGGGGGEPTVVIDGDGSIHATADRDAQAVIETLEATNASLQAEVVRLQGEWEKSEALCRQLEEDFAVMSRKDAAHYDTEDRLRGERDEARAEVGRLTTEVEGLNAKLAAEQAGTDIADLRAELERLREQVRWHKEKAKGR